jgi:hypothetical protein
MFISNINLSNDKEEGMQEEKQYNLIIFSDGCRVEIISGEPLPEETIIKIEKCRD